MNNLQNQNNNHADNTVSSKRGLIAGVIVLAVVIGLAAFFYKNGSDKNTSAGEKAVEEIAKEKEKAENYSENKDASAGNDGAGNTSDTAENKPVLAPDFTVYTKDGNAVHFSDKIGKPMIINFWATWCGPCKMEMPHFEKAYKEYGNRIEFMMINPTDGVNDTHENVDKFIADTGYTFPVYRDTKSDAVVKYSISAFPTTFFVDSNGYFLGYYTGTMNEETLYTCIDIVLGN